MGCLFKAREILKKKQSKKAKKSQDAGNKSLSKMNKVELITIGKNMNLNLDDKLSNKIMIGMIKEEQKRIKNISSDSIPEADNNKEIEFENDSDEEDDEEEEEEEKDAEEKQAEELKEEIIEIKKNLSKMDKDELIESGKTVDLLLDDKMSVKLMKKAIHGRIKEIG